MTDTEAIEAVRKAIAELDDDTKLQVLGFVAQPIQKAVERAMFAKHDQLCEADRLGAAKAERFPQYPPIQSMS